MNLLDFWKREGLDERDLWSNWDWYYRIGLLQFALNNKNIEHRHLWLYNIAFNFRTQVRRVNQYVDGMLPATLEEWLTLSDKIYANWLAPRCLPSTAPSVTFIGDIVNKLSDPISFPRDNVVYAGWRGLAEAIQVIDKRMSDLETERRKVLLETHNLRRQIDHVSKLSFVQERFSRVFDNSKALSQTVPGNVSSSFE